MAEKRKRPSKSARAEGTDPAEPAPGADRAVGAQCRDDDREYDLMLRPSCFDEFVGQTKLKENLRIYVEAARKRGGALDHVLLCGPPGLGKTTLALILGREMGVNVAQASGPAVEHKGQLAALLTKLEHGDVLFIDEIHRLTPIVEENLYAAVEDFKIDIVQGDGPFANTLQLSLRPFTLVGATTRTGLLTGPMLSRFGIVERLDYYPAEHLSAIVKRSAGLLKVPVADEAAREIARRARGTPRIANRLLRRARDFAEVLGDGRIDLKMASEALGRLQVDAEGLDEMDRRLLRVIIEYYKGGPVGVETLSAALSEPRDTLEDVYEPYLIQQGFLARTARGRVATEKAFRHLGLSLPRGRQAKLF